MRIPLIIVVLISLIPSAAFGDWKNVVTDYGADPTGAADSQPNFQNAMNAAAIGNIPGVGNTGTGMTLYVPRGRYKFGASVTIMSSGVRIVGEGTGDEYLSGGSRIEVTTATPAFQIAGTTFGVLNVAASGIVIENLRIYATGSAIGLTNGIAIDTTVPYSIMYTHANDVFRNLHIYGFANGITSSFSSSSTRSIIKNLTVQNCVIRNNGASGLYIEDFDDLKVIGCDFTTNGIGLRLRPYGQAGTSTFQYSTGGAYIQACSFKYNGQGINLKGEVTSGGGLSADNAIRDVHISGCKMNNNNQQSVTISEANNVEITNCTLVENNGNAAINLGHCNGVSMIGCTMKSNLYAGLQISALSSNVTLASCSLADNNTGNTGIAAVKVLGGSNITFSNITFSVGTRQTAGFLLQGDGVNASSDPKRVLMQGCNFEAGMNSIVTESLLTGAQTYMCEFYSPQNWTGATPASTYYNQVMQFIRR